MIAFYDGQPVVIFEHDIDNSTGNRRSRWWRAAQADDPNKTSGTLPFAMTDSGYRFVEGSSASKYMGMINESLAVPAALDIEASQWRVGASQDLRVWGTLTNVSDTVYGYDNEATLNIIVYEETQFIHVDHFVRMAIEVEFEQDLEPGGTIEFDHTITVPGRPDFTKTHAVVLADYRPVSGGRFESLQAAVATPSENPPAPANDLAASSTEIGKVPFSETQTSVGASTEPDEAAASCGRGKENSIWFSITPDEAFKLEIDTLGSDYDTIMSVWTGDAHPLTEVACNDDDPNSEAIQSWLQLDVEAGTKYLIKVTGLNGAVGMVQFNAYDADLMPTATPTELPPEPTAAPTEVPPEPTPVFKSKIFMPVGKNRVE